MALLRLPPASMLVSRIVALILVVVVVVVAGLMLMSKSWGLMFRFSVTVLDCSGSPPVTPTPSSRTRMLRNVRRYFSASLVDKGCGPVGGVVVVVVVVLGVPVTGSTVMGRVVLVSWGRLSSVEAIWRTLWHCLNVSISIIPLRVKGCTYETGAVGLDMDLLYAFQQT